MQQARLHEDCVSKKTVLRCTAVIRVFKNVVKASVKVKRPAACLQLDLARAQNFGRPRKDTVLSFGKSSLLAIRSAFVLWTYACKYLAVCPLTCHYQTDTHSIEHVEARQSAGLEFLAFWPVTETPN